MHLSENSTDFKAFIKHNLPNHLIGGRAGKVANNRVVTFSIQSVGYEMKKRLSKRFDANVVSDD